MRKGPRRISTLGSRVTSLVSVTFVLLLLGLAAVLVIAGRNITDELRRNVGFVVKIERECEPTDVDDVRAVLSHNAAVDAFTFLSADEILKQESEFIGRDIASLMDANPYSAEFSVKISKQYANADSMAVFGRVLTEMPAVQEVISESETIEGVDHTLTRFSVVLTVIALVLMVISIALISNTLSLSIYSRRFTIHTMKLVGATGSFIRRPFIRSALWSGVFAGLISSALLCLMRMYASTLDPLIPQALPWLSLALVCGAMVVTGALICTLTAYVCTNRYLKASYDEMFLK